MVNLQEDSVVVAVGGCLFTLLAYQVSPHGSDVPAWDEGNGKPCPAIEFHYHLAPGERKDLTRRIPLRDVNLPNEAIPAGRYYFVARVQLSVRPEPLIMAGIATIDEGRHSREKR
jgi:hypothetical protein